MEAEYIIVFFVLLLVFMCGFILGNGICQYDCKNFVLLLKQYDTFSRCITINDTWSLDEIKNHNLGYIPEKNTSFIKTTN